MKHHLAALMLSVVVLPAAASAQPTPPPAADNTQPFEEQAERNAALKSGDKAAIAKTTADENAAFAKWRELLKGLDQTKVTEFAEAIGEAQRDYFEAHCGGRSMGQEIMAWSGIAYFYDFTFTHHRDSRREVTHDRHGM